MFPRRTRPSNECSTDVENLWRDRDVGVADRTGHGAGAPSGSAPAGRPLAPQDAVQRRCPSTRRRAYCSSRIVASRRMPSRSQSAADAALRASRNACTRCGLQRLEGEVEHRARRPHGRSPCPGSRGAATQPSSSCACCDARDAHHEVADHAVAARGRLRSTAYAGQRRREHDEVAVGGERASGGALGRVGVAPRRGRARATAGTGCTSGRCAGTRSTSGASDASSGRSTRRSVRSGVVGERGRVVREPQRGRTIGGGGGGRGRRCGAFVVRSSRTMRRPAAARSVRAVCAVCAACTACACGRSDSRAHRAGIRSRHGLAGTASPRRRARHAEERGEAVDPGVLLAGTGELARAHHRGVQQNPDQVAKRLLGRRRRRRGPARRVTLSRDVEDVLAGATTPG